MSPLYAIVYPLLRPLLFRLEPEQAYRLTLAILAKTPHFAPWSDPPALNTSVFGLSFSNPIGLAAGMDKNALAIPAWNAIGFGFAEIGTVTPQPQSGNPLPRIWRLPKHRALINRMGFPSDGMDMIAGRLRKVRSRTMRMRVGVNLGPNRKTPEQEVTADFAALTRRLAISSDFIIANISSPNTPGLRNFQAPELMRTVVEAIRLECHEIGREPPLLIKLSPDLESTTLGEICAATLELGVAGIVATNTTLKHAEVGVVSSFEGGLSGEPLKERAREVIGLIHEFTHGRIPIIGVGGIDNAEDAYSHILAGASLIEMYTGLVYRGPGLVNTVKSGLRRLLIRDGFRSISEAVGAAH
jgi:dihydroorotate dehydrogenase